MNKYEHAESSSIIFGGKAPEYEAFHALIDSNKTVTPSIFGRFYLHHFDFGVPILKKVFGDTVGKKKISVEDLMYQHLLEDYGQILTFRGHWLPALEENSQLLPRLDTWGSFIEKALSDPRLQTLIKEQLQELDDFFQLKTLTKDSWLLDKKSAMLAIFGHALGGDLAARILGKKFHNQWTNDVITGYLNCRFVWSERNRDPVPTLLDWEKAIPDRSWMHAPREYSSMTPGSKEIKNKILDHKSQSKKIKQAMEKVKKQQRNFIITRKPCNFD